jgi:hypothetical protein
MANSYLVVLKRGLQSNVWQAILRQAAMEPTCGVSLIVARG